MRLFVLGSGSSGNCYLLENETECLIIEAGVPYEKVKKAIDFQTRKIVGVIAGHRHGDHAEYIKDYARTGIRTLATADFWHEHVGEWWFQNGERYDDARGFFKIGNFNVKAFPLTHSVPCFGFYITHPDMGILVYASDTEYIKHTFKNVNHFLVEANYSKELVERDSAKYEHQITGHMNIDTTCRFLKKNNNSNLKTVTLCHLSADCGNEEDFKARAEQVVDCPVYVAKKGLEINLDLIPDWAK